VPDQTTVSNPKNIKHLVFDMGGVLVQIDWHGRVSKLLGKDIPFEDIHRLWGESVAATDFEHGQSDFATFCEGFIKENNLTIQPAQFEQEFRDIIQEDSPGICELLAQLKPHFTLSLLSNTNPYHWEMMQNRNTFLSYIENPYTSLDFGIMKPSPAIYKKLVESLNCEPSEILFFDDGLINVEAARKLGLNAEQVFGTEDIRVVLKEYRLA